MRASTKPIGHRLDEGFGFTAGFGRPEPMPFSHAHGDLELNYVFNGSVAYFHGGRFVELPQGLLAAFWAAIPHQVVETSPGTEFMCLHVPLSSLLRWNLGNSFLRKVLAGEVVVDPKSPTWDFDLTRRWIEDLRGRDAALKRTVELEVEARLRRLAQKRQHRTARRSAAAKGKRQVEAITEYLFQHYREELSTADVGEAVGLHPNYAMSLFRRECGMSIWTYLTRLRLAHAQLMLITTDKTVLNVALDSGFGSLARFYAAFTRECGMAPGQYRRLSS